VRGVYGEHGGGADQGGDGEAESAHTRRRVIVLIILLTCLLSYGETFTPPPHWDILKITAGGVSKPHAMLACVDKGMQPIPCREETVPTKIHLRRVVQPQAGHHIEIPQGCTASMEVTAVEEKP
jgi:hypothetical protein